jgi:hypothetical protein
VPYGRPNLRSQLHFGHSQKGDYDVYMDMWWYWREKERERKKMEKKKVFILKGM